MSFFDWMQEKQLILPSTAKGLNAKADELLSPEGIIKGIENILLSQGARTAVGKTIGAVSKTIGGLTGTALENAKQLVTKPTQFSVEQSNRVGNDTGEKTRQFGQLLGESRTTKVFSPVFNHLFTTSKTKSPNPVPVMPTVRVVAEKTQQTKLQNFVKPEYSNTIYNNSNKYGVDPKLVSAIIMNENRSWDPALPAGDKSSTSIGLGQINNATYTDIKKIIGPFDRTNAEDSIRAITAWIKNISKRIGSNKPEDIARAYNIGVSGFLKHPKEADGYIETFSKFYNQ